ncbi:MAG: deoxynucleoside kinase [Anaerolineales bacterium]|nr:deoxynucleoside kinase [Anaerolineales bacterium]
MKQYVAVAGNIGVGKSTLVDKLCARFAWEPYYEPVAENPYLSDFYADMKTWAFHSQIFFLSHRLRMHLSLLADPKSVVQDRSMYEDAEVFAANLYRQGQISKRDYATYRKLYDVLCDMLHPPDLVIYLQASLPTLQKRITMRGRDFESNIDPQYLIQLNDLYEDWINNFTLCPVLVVPTDNMDFVAHNGHLELIAQKVEARLQGQEQVIFSPEEVRSYSD